MSHRPHMSRPYMSHHVTNIYGGILASDKSHPQKSQVGIISLGTFQVFSEARANTRSPRSNGFTTAEINRKHCSNTGGKLVDFYDGGDHVHFGV